MIFSRPTTLTSTIASENICVKSICEKLNSKDTNNSSTGGKLNTFTTVPSNLIILTILTDLTDPIVT